MRRPLANLLSTLFVFAAAIGVEARAASPEQRALPAPGFDLRTWRAEDGLPSDAVNALAQTPDGYLWISTNAGLARFDGVEFTVFDRRSTPELQNDQCGPLLVDRDGALYIGTMAAGLTRYADGRFEVIPKPPDAAFQYVFQMMQDPQGRLWIGTNERLYVLEDGTLRAAGADVGIPQAHQVLVFKDGTGGIWLRGDDGRLSVIRDGIARETKPADEGVPAELTGSASVAAPSPGVFWISQWYPNRLTRRALGADTSFDLRWNGPSDPAGRILALPNGDVWLGLRESGLRLVRGEEVVEIGVEQGFPAGPISALLRDREGNIWVGSTSGVTRIKDRSFASLDPANGLERERAWTAFEDRNGRLWFGTDNGAWRVENGRVTRFGLSEGLPGLGVTSFAEDADGTLWIGSNAGLVRFDRDRCVPLDAHEGLQKANVRALYTDRRGRLWIGTAGGVAVRENGRLRNYTIADGLGADWVRFIHEDASGDFWFATSSGLSRLHDGTITTFRSKDGLANDQVLSIHEEASGALWFGTFGGGVTRYLRGAFATISKRDGLHDDVILRILEDEKGGFWMSSPHGIFRVGRVHLNDVADRRLRSLTSVVFDKSDGLPTTDIGGGTQPSGWRARDGRMWFPTGRGVTVVDPERVRVNTEAPIVHVEEVLYDLVHPGGNTSATLPAGSKTVEFRYTATLLSEPERARFRYRLEPFDADWVEAGTRRVAYYTALRPGRYRFHVTAANESGVWSATGATYDLRVTPFFYETRTFLGLCVALIGLTAWGAYRLRIRQIEARYAAVLSERGRIARELHDTIAQGFTGVSMQLEAASAKLPEASDDARENLDRARLLVRTSLSDARRSVRALRPHLLESGDLGASLRAVASQLSEGTSVRASVQVRGLRRRLPPEIEDGLFRVGQEAMTNAIRHGRCASLEVELHVAGGMATLTVADDGTGFEPTEIAPGSGLTGMIERLKRLGGTVRIESAGGAGTKVIAVVPVNRSRTEEAV